MKRREIQAKLPEIVEFSGVEKFLDTPVKRYSSGMYVRLAFSVAAHLEPEILLVDEVLAVGDAEFQARCLGRMEDFGATRADRALRLAQHAGDRAALRPRDPARRRAASCATARARRSSPTISRRRRAPARAGRGPTSRSAPGDDLVRLRSVRVVDGGRLDRLDYVDVRRAGRYRDRLPRARRRARRVSRRSRSRPAGASRSTRWTSTRAGTSRRQPGDYVATAWIPGNFLNEGLDHRRRRSLLDRLAEAPPPRQRLRGGLVPRPGSRARATPRAGTFTGQWRGVVRPLLDWTANERTLGSALS